MSLLLVFSETGIESCSVKTTIRQDITKIIQFFFYKIGVSFQYSLLNMKVWKFIKNEILHRYFSRAIVKWFILQLYRTTVLLAQLQMTATDYLLKNCDQKN